MEKGKTATRKIVDTVRKTATKAGASVVKNPISLLYVGGGILAVIAAYKLAKWAKDASDTVSGDNIDNTIPVRVIPDTSRTTITRNEARNFASQLLTAFNWKGFMLLPYPHYGEGTDNNVVKSIFDRINSEDFKVMYQEFDTKDYNGYSSPPSNIGGGIQDALGISEKRDLVYWLRSELDFFDFSLKKRVKEIVEGAGFIF